MLYYLVSVSPYMKLSLKTQFKPLVLNTVGFKAQIGCIYKLTLLQFCLLIFVQFGQFCLYLKLIVIFKLNVKCTEPHFYLTAKCFNLNIQELEKVPLLL